MNQRLKLRKRGTGSNLADMGRDAVRADFTDEEATPMPGNVDRLGGHAEGLRRRRDDAAGAELGTDPVDRDMVNVGTVRDRPCAPARHAGVWGQAHRRLVVAWRGGAFVVVRGRESRSHGEGGQRVRRPRCGMPGGRR